MREVSRGEHGFGKRSGFRPLTPSEAAFVSALTQRQVRRMRNASIIEPGQTDAPLYTLHQGWAFRYVPFADGSRQIVEFLLPGDLVGLPAAFLPRMIYGVEALTRVELSLHSRETVDRIFAEQPDLAKALVRGLIDDRRRSDFRLAVLGQKQGPHRIAYDVLRRVAVIKAAQRAGIPLASIRHALASLPEGRTPTAEDWSRLSAGWKAELDQRIGALTKLRDHLSDCIGCGCLSLSACPLRNPQDMLFKRGPGPQLLELGGGEE